MKKYIITVLILLFYLCPVYADTITDLEGITGEIGQEDFDYGTGESTDTFTVPTYDGSTQTLTKVPNPNPDGHSKIKNVWYVNNSSSITDHGSASGADYISGNLKKVIDIVSTDEQVIELPGGTDYPLITNTTVAETTTIAFQRGAVLDLTGDIIFSGSESIDAGNYQIFKGSGTVTFADGTMVYGSWFPTLSDAMASIGSTEVLLIVKDSVPITTNVTIPTTVDLIILGAGKFDISSGVTSFAINSNRIAAGSRQIFDGTYTAGEILIPNVEMNPYWFIPSENHAAVRDGSIAVDLSSSLNTMAQAGTRMLFPYGTYTVDGGTNYTLSFNDIQSNSVVTFSPEATLKVLDNNYTQYAAIHLALVDNVLIQGGGKILGDLDNHTDLGGESGFGIHVHGSTNIKIRDLYISKFWGDGVLLMVNGASWTEDVTLDNVTMDDNRRQGSSVVSTRRATYNNCRFFNTGATAVTLPGYGLDLEAETPAGANEDIVITNCIFKGNVNGGLGILNSTKVTADGNTFEDNSNGILIGLGNNNVILTDNNIRESGGGIISTFGTGGERNTVAFAAVTTGTDKITVTGHGYTEDQLVRVYTDDTMPSPLTIDTDYYIIDDGVNTIQLEATLGGGAINITTQGTGNHTIYTYVTSASNNILIDGNLVEATRCLFNQDFRWNSAEIKNNTFIQEWEDVNITPVILKAQDPTNMHILQNNHWVFKTNTGTTFTDFTGTAAIETTNVLAIKNTFEHFTDIVGAFTTLRMQDLDSWEDIYYKSFHAVRNFEVFVGGQALPGYYERGDQILSGTTAQRPTRGINAGMQYWDSTLGALIVYNGSSWDELGLKYDGFVTLANDATPTVLNVKNCLSGGTTTITDFDDGVTSQILIFVAEHSLTITDGTNIFLNGSANFVMTATDTLTLIQKADGKWYELGRGDNGA